MQSIAPGAIFFISRYLSIKKTQLQVPDSYLHKLTAEQLRVVRHNGQHARVSAVAGSGKTTTMIGRIGHLLASGVRPDEIMVLMFNRSARDAFESVMRQRLGTQFGSNLPEIRTFHSLGHRLVQSFTRRGVLPEFQLVTEEYRLERLARQVATEAYRKEHETGWPPAEDIEEFLNFIDLVKSATDAPKKVFRRLDRKSVV